MDLIALEYDNANNKFVKIQPITNRYTFSCSTGMSAYTSNDFELKMPYEIGENLLEIGQFLMYGNTEYGGIITQRVINTQNSEITYAGPSLRGFLSNHFVRNDNTETKTIVNHAKKLLSSPFGGDKNYTIINNSSNDEFPFAPTLLSSVMDSLDSVANLINSVYTFNIHNGKINITISLKKEHKFDASQVNMVLDENYSKANQVIVYNPDAELFTTGQIESVPRFLLKQKVVESNKTTLEELNKVAKKELLKERAVIATDIFADLQDAEVGDVVVASILEIGIKVQKMVVEKSIKINNGNAEITYILEG